MKLMITENQIKDAINILLEDESTDSALEPLRKIMALYHDPVSELKKRYGAGIEKFLGKLGQNTDTTTRSTAPNVPAGVEFMNPLGQSQFRITSNFNTNRGGRPHKSIDMAVPSGTPVYSPANGRVVSARDTSPNACGGFIKIDHANLVTKFCHLRKWVVSVGQYVKQGDLIGYTGGGRSDPYRGRSTGPHLHYEILNKEGLALNPQQSQFGIA